MAAQLPAPYWIGLGCGSRSAWKRNTAARRGALLRWRSTILPALRHCQVGLVNVREYRHLLAFIFAVDEINRRSDILPNITLGYHVHDSCGNVNKAIRGVMQILSGHKKTVPNYSCMKNGKLIGFVGDLHSSTTVPMAKFLHVYGYSQISYGATDSVLSNRHFFPNFFRTVQNNQMQYGLMAKLLHHLGWNWVGIISSDDDRGEEELQQLSKQLEMQQICIEFKIRLSVTPENETESRMPASDGRTQQRTPRARKDKFPCGRCTSSCLPGYRKVKQKGHHICCYDCIPCSEGEMSDVTDSENCHKCPEKEWPNEMKDKCVAKTTEFLSLEKDISAVTFSVISVLFAVIADVILGVFIAFRDTPIVRANNRNLSLILLISIKLSLLSIFLFLGHPVDITCMLRQVTFGITYTVCISSVLAKTIMVCISFKATRPGSTWRKWLGIKLANRVLLMCSTVQVQISIVWLSVSPPFQELDVNSYPGKIIIQCNEGSVLAFYLMLAYMGFLSALSFVLAFMVRTLPDVFNEAKYITFSLLVFCCIWTCAIAVYLSSKGKQMVIVEIFAILTSSISILCCIFFPKCYVILMKPKLNIRKQVMTNRSIKAEPIKP
ncbi:PREDICTED: vomeronasal type-2 receptor 26-like [Nanorana parkeri]|uniref:vomeronasal type-2 receptor 26-like n=1 Tax=Nanorana parkeri TaxID=125878 RepID=UPI000854F743|nr:PREDICTED: vomeronasal type-2 receptor 26-like [Nanorana parkeri]